ncbi:MAG: hypothetical protein PHV23_03830 [Candidatus Gracilibacteria bacterium]|nr:hypothetical protein [Candidatus Gracilibacteria bacterium]
MPIIKYKETDERFKELDPKPLPLLIEIYIRTTSEGVYECICPISGNIINIGIEGKVKCDVSRDSRITCGNIGLEDKVCPYKKNMI